METGGTQSPTSEAKEARVMETSTQVDGEKPPGTPYSPSAPLSDTDDENKMDWETNLSGNGIKRLFKQPPNTTEEEACKTDADKVDPALQNTQPNAAIDKEPPKEAGHDSHKSGEDGANKRADKEVTETSSGAPTAGSQKASGNSRAEEPTIPLALKVTNFLGRAKEKIVTEIKTRMGRDMLIYDAISASNTRAASAANIMGGKSADPVQGPSFLELGDGRIMSGGLQLDMTNKHIVSTSFTADWKCLRCPQHSGEPALKMRGAADSSCSKQVIVVADQSSQPCCLSAARKAVSKLSWWRMAAWTAFWPNW
jgi:hypothetical protein